MSILEKCGKYIRTAAALAAIGAASAVGAADITGAGATFPYPVYSKWAEAYKKATGTGMNYQSIGSGGGIKQIIAKTVDFGASDAPMSGSDLEKNGLTQFPMVMGGVVPVVNIQGVKPGQMRLTGAVIADIYLGKIRSWDDKRIQADNKDIKLPKLPIAPVYRADGSGTTYVFTTYLRTVSYNFLKEVGNGTSVKWKTGNGAKGNDGVTAVVKQVKGAIGYVESTYASQNHLIVAQLQSANGHWVVANNDSFIAAAKNADWKSAPNFAVDLLNQPGDHSWPIVSTTFILIPTNPVDANKTKLIANWLGWSFANGGAMATALDYVPLPASVQEQVMAGIKKIH